MTSIGKIGNTIGNVPSVSAPNGAISGNVINNLRTGKSTGRTPFKLNAELLSNFYTAKPVISSTHSDEIPLTLGAGVFPIYDSLSALEFINALVLNPFTDSKLEFHIDEDVGETFKDVFAMVTPEQARSFMEEVFDLFQEAMVGAASEQDLLTRSVMLHHEQFTLLEATVDPIQCDIIFSLALQEDPETSTYFTVELAVVELLGSICQVQSITKGSKNILKINCVPNTVMTASPDDLAVDGQFRNLARDYFIGRKLPLNLLVNPTARTQTVASLIANGESETLGRYLTALHHIDNLVDLL